MSDARIIFCVFICFAHAQTGEAADGDARLHQGGEEQGAGAAQAAPLPHADREAGAAPAYAICRDPVAAGGRTRAGCDLPAAGA